MTIRMSGTSGTIADHVKILFNVGTDAGLNDGELLTRLRTDTILRPRPPSPPSSEGTGRW